MTDLIALNAAQVESESDPFTETRYKQFARWISPTARDLLDVGCNTGRGGLALKAALPGLAIVGLDLVEARLDRLPRAAYSRAICGSAAAIPCADDAFDAVVAGEFIEHLRPLDAMAFFHEAFRVLRIGGVLALTTPNPSDIKRRLRGKSVLGGSHVSQHHQEALVLQFQMAGFGSVSVRGTGKVSWYLGTRFPLKWLYGSFLVAGRKY
ncbi:MAG: class I SAM-dependent methyltransferase [Burkholderiaceae bacterium]